MMAEARARGRPRSASRRRSGPMVGPEIAAGAPGPARSERAPARVIRARVAAMQRPADTSAEAHERYLERLRRLSPEERLATAATLSAEVRVLAEAGVRSRHPEYGPDQVRAAVTEILLGSDSATA